MTKSAADGAFLPGMESDLGIGNRLTLLDEEILKNLHDVQLRHGCRPRPDAVDAYEQKLVKQIEVASAGIEGAHNKPYVRLLSVNSRRGVITAKVEIDVETAGGVRRQEKTVQDGDDLEQTTGRAVYANCRVGEIRVERGNQFMELRVPGGEAFLKPGEEHGGVEPLFSDDLRHQEGAKIKCGEAHFKAIAGGGNPARFRKAIKVDDLFT